MKFCTQCGSQFLENAKFCASCGSEVDEWKKKTGDSETKEPSIGSAVAGIPKAPEEKEKTNTILSGKRSPLLEIKISQARKALFSKPDLQKTQEIIEKTYRMGQGDEEAHALKILSLIHNRDEGMQDLVEQSITAFPDSPLIQALKLQMLHDCERFEDLENIKNNLTPTLRDSFWVQAKLLEFQAFEKLARGQRLNAEVGQPLNLPRKEDRFRMGEYETFLDACKRLLGGEFQEADFFDSLANDQFFAPHFKRKLELVRNLQSEDNVEPEDMVNEEPEVVSELTNLVPPEVVSEQLDYFPPGDFVAEGEGFSQVDNLSDVEVNGQSADHSPEAKSEEDSQQEKFNDFIPQWYLYGLFKRWCTAWVWFF